MLYEDVSLPFSKNTCKQLKQGNENRPHLIEIGNWKFIKDKISSKNVVELINGYDRGD